ncbi:MAG: nuclease [Prosthecochloris sp.]|nr:nuclease [Prosthecochloris sp.]
MKQKNLLLTLLLLLTAVLITVILRLDTQSGDYTVLHVADGDSFTLTKEREEVEIRLFGIDCPERKQPFYRKAERFTRTVLREGEIRFTAVDRDRYGRVIAWVYVDSLCLNEELLRNGLAWHYKRYSDDANLARLEDSARTAKTGLWIDPNPVPPWEFRRQHRN